MTSFELRPAGSPGVAPTAIDLEWTSVGAGAGMLRSTLSPDLVELGTVPTSAIDLSRIATAAYLADQLQARSSVTFSRSLDLVVHLLDPAPWTDAVLDECANLLTALTGDRWSFEVRQDQSDSRRESHVEQPRAARVALLSGGLDSLAGAVLTSAEDDVVYVGHWDNTIVKGAQDRIASWFAAAGRPIQYVQLRHQLTPDKRENSYRSRALLFVALATALASARGATVVEVPENGYTSLNPPLAPERGGALSTRSTHPDTLARMSRIMAAIGLGVTVVNPHQAQTKGELVAQAAAQSPGDFADGAALTLSCGKFDGLYYKGGDVNKNCGLCVPCLVRRASLIAAGADDRAAYLCDTLVGPSRDKLIAHRADDVEALRYALIAGLTEDDLIALAPYPNGFDFEEGLALCRRALDELARVPLP
jgi:7-cyano-7-deazaguanine synthase in queuosine biosynthesis